MSEEKHGSFLNGFTVGLFAGAAGYFLFGTKKGDSVRTQLAKEWEKAKGELEKEGVIESGKGLKEMIGDAVGKLSTPTKKNVKPKTSKTKTVKKKKFRGT
ncbi:MAG: hypothetical protein ABFQ62_00030 [Patescibacteria group bacterium]